MGFCEWGGWESGAGIVGLGEWGWERGVGRWGLGDVGLGEWGW